MSIHLLYKCKQVFFNSLFIMQLSGTRSKLMTLLKSVSKKLTVGTFVCSSLCIHAM